MRHIVMILLLAVTLTGEAWAGRTTGEEPKQPLSGPINPHQGIGVFTFIIEAGGFSKRELAEAFHNRGTFFFDLGQFKRAIEEYSRVVVLDPTNANAFYSRAKAHAALGQHGAAVEDYTAAIRLEPDHDFAFYNRANSYVAKGDWSRALSDYKKAYALNPSDMVYQDKLRALKVFD